MKLSYIFLKLILSWIISNLITECQSTENSLLDAVRNASGIYINASAHLLDLNPSIIAQLDKTVLVTAFNYGYANHLYNFRCHANRIGIKFLVISLDAHAHGVVSTLDHVSSYLWQVHTSSYNHQEIAIHEGSTRFRSEQFNIMSFIKLEAVMMIMKLGYNVIFSDPDIAIVRDPVPYLFWDGIDYVHSHNKICPQCYDWDFFKSEEEGNTGFYFVRSNTRSIKLFQYVLDAAPSYPNLDDQSVFWLVLRNDKFRNDMKILPMKSCHDNDTSIVKRKDDHDAMMITTCPLDGCMFAAGALRGVAYDWVKDNLQRQHYPLVTVHANYLKGNELKAQALRHHGYWITQHPAQYCHPFHPKYDM